MKTFQFQLLLFLIMTATISCVKEPKNEQSEAVDFNEIVHSKNKTGQAFIKDDISRPTVLSIAINSKDHKTLVAAVQAAELENALVNAGPLMVFAPTDQAFEELPPGTVENLMKPENKEMLANILKYHVTPGNYSKEFLMKFKKLGQANNDYVTIDIIENEPIIGGARIIGSAEAGNGIVHIIDKVLLPPTDQGDIIN